MPVDSTNKVAAEGVPRTSNPLYGDRKLKLATFGSNIKSGCAITSGEGALPGDWPNVPQNRKARGRDGIRRHRPGGSLSGRRRRD